MVLSLFPFSTVSSLGVVRLVYHFAHGLSTQGCHDPDVGLLAPMIGSLAANDSEIGARLGICFTFTGVSLNCCLEGRRAH